MSRLILYTKSWCPWCISARAWLDRAGFSYEPIEVGEVPGAAEELRRISGQRYVPTLLVHNADGAAPFILPDFGPDELEAFVRHHKLTPDNV
jgi:glutaredoxin 3